MGNRVAALFVRTDSVYKSLPRVDAWDKARDATQWPGGTPVIAHPPCRTWGRLRWRSNAPPGEHEMALLAVELVRSNGGVLEHPAHSTLWPSAGLPQPGHTDRFGGWTLPISQHWFGHRAEKRTWLYVLGVGPKSIPVLPFVLGEAPCVIETRRRPGSRPAVTKREREATPPALAKWLCKLALSVPS